MDARSAYRLLAGSYDQQPNALVSLEQRTMASLFPDVRGKTVVDAAAGTGRWARYCVMGGARVVHLAHNVLIKIEGNHASGYCDFTYYHCKDNRIQQESIGFYTDVLRKTDSGWRFGSRCVTILGSRVG